MRCGSCGVATRCVVSDSRVLACSLARCAALCARSSALSRHDDASAISASALDDSTSLRRIRRTLPIVRARTGGEPRAHVLRLRRELPFVPDEQRHRAMRAVALALSDASLLQPSLELLRVGPLTHRIFEYLPLNREADGVRGRVARPSAAPPLARIECAQKAAAH